MRGSRGESAFMRQMVVLFAMGLLTVAYYVFSTATGGRLGVGLGLASQPSMGIVQRSATDGGAAAVDRRAGQDLQMVVTEGDEYSRWIKYDWMKARPLAEILKDFREHIESPQWEKRERVLSCGNKEVDELVIDGVFAVQRHIQMDYVNPVDKVDVGAEYFEKALERDPTCATAILNLAILLPHMNGDYQRVHTLLEKIPQNHPLHTKSLMWIAIAHELMGEHRAAHEHFLQAFAMDPELSVQYFGKPADVWGKEKGAELASMFEDRRLKSEEGYRVQVVCMKKMLLYNEYAKHFTGYNHFTLEQARQFHENWYAPVKNILPPYVLRALQDCYRVLIAKKVLRFDDKQAKRYFHHSSAPARFLGGIFAEFISRVWGNKMKSTYAYMGGYPSGSKLNPHVDRAQCEITMSLSIDVNPVEEACPLGLAKQPKYLSKTRSKGPNAIPEKIEDRAYAHLMAGDAVFFRGRALVHWREQIPEGMNCTNLFLHYVNWDYEGKYA
eukprot:TRINITY_DN7189_c0_g1_i1.p1 TRINITY_DN7189_c0_g1~~TRINITY_DN7189_c0_g1_i1.p1  ORF type:complete len:498 (+),score=208.99 TRINITY_DN7189_c0_g1_i1:62-1555(+)